jgi:hypothetical protein
MKTIARAALAAALLVVPATAFASCEQILSVHSRELGFTYVGTAVGDTQVSTAEQRADEFRSLAYGLEVAAWAFDYARAHPHAARATRIVLLAAGKPAPEDLDDPAAVALASAGRQASFDSTCTLWTIEIGRFRTEQSALTLSDGTASDYQDSANDRPGGDAVIYFETCAGTWQPGSFVVRAGGVAPWSVRRGLHLTREDANRAAKEWGSRARVMRQRVDGAVLEQALREPVEGC